MTDDRWETSLLEEAYDAVQVKLEALPTLEGKEHIISTDDISRSFGLDPEEVQEFFQMIMAGAVIADAQGMDLVHSSTLMMVFFIGIEYGRKSG